MVDLCLTNMQLGFHKTLTDGLERCGLLVYYFNVCISCLDSHSDDTIHCRGSSDISSNQKQLIYVLDGLRVSAFSQNKNFGVHNSFKMSLGLEILVKYV